MDSLVKAFSSKDDMVVVATDEGDIVDDGVGNAGNGDGDAGDEDGDASDGDGDASDASEGDPKDAVSDMSD